MKQSNKNQMDYMFYISFYDGVAFVRHVSSASGPDGSFRVLYSTIRYIPQGDIIIRNYDHVNDYWELVQNEELIALLFE